MEIEIVTRRLKKHIYKFSEITKSSGEMKMQEEKKESAKDLCFSDKKSPACEDESFEKPKNEMRENTKDDVPGLKRKKLRVLNRSDFSIFDTTEEEEKLLEEKLDELINCDGYYDEVKPLDEGHTVEFKKNRRFRQNIALFSGVIIVALALIIYIISIF